MALGTLGRTPFWNCDLAQSRSGIAPIALCDCIALASDCFGPGRVYPHAFEFSIRLSEGSNLGIVKPIHAALPAQRSLLVVNCRNGLAKSTPAKFSLLSDPDRLRDCGFAPVHWQLETRNALGARNRARAWPDFAPLVLRLDFADRGVAKRLCLERSLGHTFRLLFILGRTAFWSALARRAVDAQPHHRAGSGRFSYAWRAKENGGGSDLIAFSKSFGSVASKFFHSPVRGC